MRLLIAVMVLILFVVVGAFLVTNLDANVTVQVWGKQYPDLWVGYVVLVSLVAGVLFTSILAIADGAKTKFEGRASRREILKLEAEIDYLRAQPPAGAGEKNGEPTPPESRPPERPAERRPEVASAPVYETDPDPSWPHDPDDDAYSGGSAV